MQVLFFDKNFTRVENGFHFLKLSIARAHGNERGISEQFGRSKNLSVANQQVFHAIYGPSLCGFISTNHSSDLTAIYDSGSRSCSVKFACSLFVSPKRATTIAGPKNKNLTTTQNLTSRKNYF
jgi:hypothetical protein